MRDDGNRAVDDDQVDIPPGAYEPPTVAVLGTVEELTRGPVGVGGDLNGMVISF